MSAPLKYYSCIPAIEYQDINALKTIASPIIILGVTGCDLDDTYAMQGAVSRNLSKLKHCELPPKKVKQKFYPSKH